MCLESAGTAAFPEPLSSPAGGQECDCEWVVVVRLGFFFFPSRGQVCVCVRESARVGLSPACVCVHAWWRVHRFNKAAGPPSTICQCDGCLMEREPLEWDDPVSRCARATGDRNTCLLSRPLRAFPRSSCLVGKSFPFFFFLLFFLNIPPRLVAFSNRRRAKRGS